jgi:GNAT superfamily N-acetyltransferase
MEFENLTDPGSITSAAIRDRATQSSITRHTQRYIAVEGGVEVAFVSLDVRPNADYLVLYDLFVPREYRGAGLGTRILQEVNRLAGDLGYEFIVTKPKAFENPEFQDRLVNWYQRNGYVKRPGRPDELQRDVRLGRAGRH